MLDYLNRFTEKPNDVMWELPKQINLKKLKQIWKTE